MELNRMPESITVTIESLGARGDGIAKHDGKPVYVPGALPGEVVQVQVVETRKSGLYTRMLDVKEPSRQRCRLSANILAGAVAARCSI